MDSGDVSTTLELSLMPLNCKLNMLNSDIYSLPHAKKKIKHQNVYLSKTVVFMKLPKQHQFKAGFGQIKSVNRHVGGKCEKEFTCPLQQHRAVPTWQSYLTGIQGLEEFTL